jgi:RHS repeat-associated protein
MKKITRKIIFIVFSIYFAVFPTVSVFAEDLGSDKSEKVSSVDETLVEIEVTPADTKEDPQPKEEVTTKVDDSIFVEKEILLEKIETLDESDEFVEETLIETVVTPADTEDDAQFADEAPAEVEGKKEDQSEVPFLIQEPIEENNEFEKDAQPTDEVSTEAEEEKEENLLEKAKDAVESVVDFFDEKIVEPVKKIFVGEENYDGEHPILFYSQKDSSGETEFEVVNALMDVAYLPNGKRTRRVYSEPRLVYEDGKGKMKVHPAGWNWFNEMEGSRLEQKKEEGYAYTVPLSEKEYITVKSGNYEIAGILYPSQKASFDKYEKELNTFTEYRDLYTGVDVQFKDSGRYRERKIILEDIPKGLKQREEIIFWEEYELPIGSVVTTREGKILEGVHKLSEMGVFIETPGGNGFVIGDAVVFDDNVGNSEDEMDISSEIYPVLQVVDVDSTVGKLKIGLKLDASYLLNGKRKYPVTIDPRYYPCKYSVTQHFSCSLTDMYLRYLTSRESSISHLYLGYYLASDGHASRVPALKFDIDFPAQERVTDARVYMFYNELGSGNYRGDVNTVARRIPVDHDWNENTLRYTDIRANLETISEVTELNTGMGRGNKFWTITDEVERWRLNPGQNKGIVIEPTPAWPSGANPPWQNVQFKFYSSNHNLGALRPHLRIDTTVEKPDLTKYNNATTISPTTLAAGETIEASIAVANLGAVATNSSANVRFYFSQSNGSYRAEYQVASMNVAATNPNYYRTVNVNYTVPEYMPAGDDYYFYYKIDYLDSIDESDEENNEFSQSITVQAVQKPNLKPENNKVNNATSNITVNPGSNIALSNSVYNRGNANAGSSRQGYYLSSNTTWGGQNGSDVNLGDNYVKSLTPGNSSGETKTVTIPAGTALGNYYILFVADYQGSIDEGVNENDNVQAIPISVVMGQDAYESGDNTYSGATNIGTNTNYTNNQHNLTPGDEDWYKFIYENNTYYFKVDGSDEGSSGEYNISFTRSGQNITIETSERNGSADTYLYLYDTNHSTLLDSDDDDGDGNFSSITYEFPFTGYCSGGCSSGGSTPPPSQDLPDQDNDNFPDVEEVYVGNNYQSAVQTAPQYDAQYKSYSQQMTDIQLANYGADPVNLRTGVFEFTQTDFTLKGRGVPIDFVRTYNSKVTDKNSRIGNGWHFSHNIYYYQDAASKNIQVYLGGTLTTIFTTSDGGQTFSPPKGEYDELFWEGDMLVYKTLEGIRYEFDRRLTSQLGILNKIVDTNGNTTQFDYIERFDVPLLSEITDASGRRVTFAYGAEGGSQWDKIVQLRETVNAQNPRTIQYDYDSSGNLTTVTDNRFYDGQTDSIVKQYEYNAQSELLRYIDPRGTILYNEYDGAGRVVRQQEYNPRIDSVGVPRTVYELQYQGGIADAPGSTSCTTVLNYRDGATHYDDLLCFNSDGFKIYQKKGDSIDRWQYNSAGMVSVYTDQNGNNTSYTYDARRRTTGSVFADQDGWHTEIAYQYENNFNRLTQQQETTTKGEATLIKTTVYDIDEIDGDVNWVENALGRRDVFTYDNYGNVLSHTDKRGNTVSYQYDANGNYKTRDTQTVTQVDGTNQTISTQYAYDVYGNVTQLIDPNNNPTTFVYDTKGNLRRQIDAFGHNKTFTYDLEGHKIQEVDERGDITNYQYDTDIEASLIRIEKVDHADANNTIVLHKEYDWVGNLTRELDGRGYANIYTYNAENRVTQKRDSYNTIDYTYDGIGNLIRESNVLGQKVEYIYDEQNNLVQTKKFIDDVQFVQADMQYDGFGRVIVSTDYEGNQTNFTYNLLGEVSTQRDSFGKVTIYNYDTNGNLSGVLQPRALGNASLRNTNGHTVSYEYDEANRKIKEINADNKETAYFYNANGTIDHTIDRQNADDSQSDHVITYDYDALNRILSQTDAYDNDVNFVYDDIGNLTRQTDELGRVSEYEYDAFSRKVVDRDPLGNVTRYTYDENGNILRTTYPDLTVTNYVYNDVNQVTRIEDNSGNATVYGYDAVGNKTTETDKRGNTTSFVYDKLNRLETETNSQATVTTYTYDNNGNKLSQSVEGTVTGFVYDALNRVTEIMHPGNKSESYSYDSEGHVLTHADGNEAANITAYLYDALGQVLSKTLSDGSVMSYLYDNWGNRTRVSTPELDTTYTFDYLNRLVQETQTLTDLPGESKTITRGYALDSQLNSLTDASGKVFQYAYDNRGLLRTVQYLDQPIATYAYNAFGKPASLTYANNYTTEYAYDNLQRLEDQTIKNAQAQAVWSHEYSYDAESNRTSLVEALPSGSEGTDRTVNYTFDTLNQLKTVNYTDVGVGVDIAYTYDKFGNRTNYVHNGDTTNYAYTPNTNELASYTINNTLSVASQYDNNGSLTQEVYTRASQPLKTVDYAWNKENRLAGVTYTDNSRPAFLPGVENNTLAFVYDDYGNRIKKSVNNEASYYINDGLRVLNELDSEGAVTKTNVYGLEMIADIDAENKLTYIHTDVLGSTVLLTNVAGDITGRYEYDAFGGTIGYEGSEQTNYLFTNQEFDIESELYYYNARYYNPKIGRFISRDTMLGHPGDMLSRNRYIYVQNNPLKFVDPTGEFRWDTFGTGLLELGKTVLDVGATVAEGFLSGVSLAVGQPTIAAVLGAGALANLDNAFVDSANSFNNIVNAFQDEPAESIKEQGPYRDVVEEIVGDTELVDMAQVGGDILSFGVKDVPMYVSKIVPAYRVYNNSRSAGVGGASLRYLLKKTSTILWEGSNIISEIFTGGSDILDIVDDSMLQKSSVGGQSIDMEFYDNK